MSTWIFLQYELGALNRDSCNSCVDLLELIHTPCRGVVHEVNVYGLLCAFRRQEVEARGMSIG